MKILILFQSNFCMVMGFCRILWEILTFVRFANELKNSPGTCLEFNKYIEVEMSIELESLHFNVAGLYQIRITNRLGCFLSSSQVYYF